MSVRGVQPCLWSLFLVACGAPAPGGDAGEPSCEVTADASCETPSPPPVTPAEDGCTLAPTFELGHGRTTFEPVEDGATLTLASGTQGGYMLLLGVRAPGLAPGFAEVCYRLALVSSGEVVGDTCWSVSARPDASGRLPEWLGFWAQVDPAWWSRVASLLDQDATLDVSLHDAAGCQSAASARIHIAPEMQ